jgi:signal transduction histidine kinase
MSADTAEIARLRQALAASEAARDAAERLVRQQAQRYELLLNLATLPDLSLEAAPVVVERPPDEFHHPAPDAADAPAAPPSPEEAAARAAARRERQARTREDTLRASVQHLVEVICAGFGADGAALLLLDHERGQFQVGGCTGSLGAALAGDAVEGGVAAEERDADRRGEGWLADAHLQRVIRRREPLLLQARGGPDVKGAKGRENEGGTGSDAPLLDRLGATALMVAPVAVEGEVRGALLVAGARAGAFVHQDLSFLSLVAARLGLLLERAELAAAQREVEQQRAQAAARQQFLGIVTHELKTPVAVLRAYAEVLLARAQKSGRAEEADLLERIDDQADRLLGMIEQVLDLQRLDAGLFPLEIGRVDLGALAARVVGDLQLANPNVRLRVEAAEQGGTRVRADRRRIEQVLTNLVQNAIRFSPAGGEVVVRVRLDQQAEGGAPRALVSVSDQGPGVPPDERARIFQRFYQGRGGAALHRGHGGLGVGLYIAHEIVARHGGDLWLEPPGDDHGATFTFALPIRPSDE